MHGFYIFLSIICGCSTLFFGEWLVRHSLTMNQNKKIQNVLVISLLIALIIFDTIMTHMSLVAALKDH